MRSGEEALAFCRDHVLLFVQSRVDCLVGMALWRGGGWAVCSQGTFRATHSRTFSQWRKERLWLSFHLHQCK